MLNVLLVGLGGGLGSMARYGTGLLVHRLFAPTWLPLGILTVNVLGCLLIGYLGEVLVLRAAAAPWRLWLLVGVLGGYTTFSSFGHDTLTLLQSGRVGGALLYVGLHVLLGIGSVWVGMRLAGVLHG